MDLSKLPRLSNTQQPAEPTPPADSASFTPAAPPPGTPSAAPSNAFCYQCGAPLRPGARFCDSCGIALASARGPAPSEAGIDAWLSIGIGVILLVLFPGFIRFLLNPSNPALNVTDVDGSTLSYAKSAFIWADGGIFLFSLVLILDGLILFLLRRPAFLFLAMCLSTVAAVFNLYAVIHAYPLIGFQQMCALAFVFAAALAMYQGMLWRSLRGL